MLRLNELRQDHIDQVTSLIRWDLDKDKVVADLLADLDPQTWSGLELPDEMIHEFLIDRDFYVELGLQFLADMRSLLLESRGLMEPYRGAYAMELHHREGLYIVSQLASMFFHRSDHRFWCLQLFNRRSLQIIHPEPWIPWNENLWLFGLKGPSEDEFFTPVLASLEFMDNIRFLQDGETVFLKNKNRKLTALVDSQGRAIQSLNATQYERFGPAMDFVCALYRGFPTRAIRENSESHTVIAPHRGYTLQDEQVRQAVFLSPGS